ncbi:MoxR family ATPase [Chamaesiphon sp. OTE_8_metabat_110]|uniref:ATP-binding protein n=1 Tax=Chamaesiphon sp. OTE_8_metabat_110 TaxID=2964696 RepID=UPI00286A3CC0|nr:MoxR family ATPase [Chamaesiphon sp. OTE_8_metabat_110]
MNPEDLKTYLDRIITNNLKISTMIWGAPGIGKSSIVAQIAVNHQLEFIDIRLSQLAPTDLRGLPVAENGVSKWFPPEFLPQQGRGILFLDEINMAPPAMQGMAQQLILDRRVGSYLVPEGWFVWAAGNRKEDRAGVFDMPAPLANRFLHLQVEPDFESFKAYALGHSVHEQIIAFLSFRPSLLHKIDPHQPAWCSPRSWMMASNLHYSGLDLAPAIGLAANAEFQAFLLTYQMLPDLASILAGKGRHISFPTEPSARYATTIGLTIQATADVDRAYHAFCWLTQVATAEWVQLYVSDLLGLMRSCGQLGNLVTLLDREPAIQKFLQDYRQLIAA